MLKFLEFRKRKTKKEDSLDRVAAVQRLQGQLIREGEKRGPTFLRIF